MQQLGIYEQLITQLIDSQLDRDHFYVGERELTSAEATVWLSRFLTHILEFAIGAVPSGEGQLQKQIELSNQLILWFKDQVANDSFFEGSQHERIMTTNQMCQSIFECKEVIIRPQRYSANWSLSPVNFQQTNVA